MYPLGYFIGLYLEKIGSLEGSELLGFFPHVHSEPPLPFIHEETLNYCHSSLLSFFEIFSEPGLTFFLVTLYYRI